MVQISLLTTVVLSVAQIASTHTLQSSGDIAARDAVRYEHNAEDIFATPLEKRRGGGGRGGGSTGSSSGSSSSGSSSGSRSGSGSTGSTGSGSRTSGTSTDGGRTITGTGPRPPYVGGAYGGGGAVPYRSGASSIGGLAPFFLVGGALAFLPGAFLYGAYSYNWNNQVTYFNQTSDMNMRAYVTCLCGNYAVCGCDENNSTFVNQIIGNGSAAALQQNGVVYLPDGNPSVRRSSATLIINGTLPNGTTAAGGTDDGSGSGSGDTGAAGGRQYLLEQAGWWATGALSLTMAYVL